MTFKGFNDIVNGVAVKKQQMIDEIYQEIDSKMNKVNLPDRLKDAVHAHLFGYFETANFDEVERLYDETVL